MDWWWLSNLQHTSSSACYKRNFTWFARYNLVTRYWCRCNSTEYSHSGFSPVCVVCHRNRPKNWVKVLPAVWLVYTPLLDVIQPVAFMAEGRRCASTRCQPLRTSQLWWSLAESLRHLKNWCHNSKFSFAACMEASAVVWMKQGKNIIIEYYDCWQLKLNFHAYLIL